MNCRQFQEKLFEYVEGSLSGSELVEARQHRSLCDGCHELVRKELQRKEVLAERLRKNTENLTLRPEVVRNIMAASRAARPAATESLAGLWMRWLRLAAMSAPLLLIAASVLVVHFSGTRTSAPVVTHLSMPADGKRPEVSIEMSYHLPRHEFHQDGNFVMDAFVDEIVVVNGTIPSGSLKTKTQL